MTKAVLRTASQHPFSNFYFFSAIASYPFSLRRIISLSTAFPQCSFKLLTVGPKRFGNETCLRNFFPDFNPFVYFGHGESSTFCPDGVYYGLWLVDFPFYVLHLSMPGKQASVGRFWRTLIFHWQVTYKIPFLVSALNLVLSYLVCLLMQWSKTEENSVFPVSWTVRSNWKTYFHLVFKEKKDLLFTLSSVNL